MAQDGERRMLFDVRGKRKNVIRVVYAILALLMGGSLFLTVGPFSISELVGGGGTRSAAEVLDEQAERIEGRLAKDPKNEAMLLSLTRARIGAANSQVEKDPATGQTIVPKEAEADYEAGLQAWNRYLKQVGKEANTSGAQLVASTHFSLAEASAGGISGIEENLRKAADAQRLVAEARPNLGTLSTLAIYEYYANDFAAGDKAAKEAEREAGKSERKGVQKQLAQYRKRGKQWEKSRKAFAKQEAKQGKEALQNPLGGFSGATATP
jgi:hypothetical protein